MLVPRRCEFLLGVIVLAAVVLSEAAPSGDKGSKAPANNEGTTPNTALIVTTKAPPGTSGEGNVTTTNETLQAAHNHTTPLPIQTNATIHSNVSNVTSHEGDAVLHYGVGSDGEVVKTPQPHKYFFTSWITWREDNYLMSILIPIACGVAAAVLILCSLACIGCCRRRCRSRNRRKLHRKIDPKTFRKMKAADRIKLLAASSDEEF
nr:uncharacterized protein LOC119167263 [Rhipicephalus microplus]XP_037274614.1 uncharacterized protein LOC119167263 [Rhipicephalus microplus]XP_037274615.1 uncharacterized protein LOC119167263 [Rhipicephalus microplus]